MEWERKERKRWLKRQSLSLDKTGWWYDRTTKWQGRENITIQFDNKVRRWRETNGIHERIIIANCTSERQSLFTYILLEYAILEQDFVLFTRMNHSFMFSQDCQSNWQEPEWKGYIKSTYIHVIDVHVYLSYTMNNLIWTVNNESTRVNNKIAFITTGSNGKGWNQ